MNYKLADKTQNKMTLPNKIGMKTIMGLLMVFFIGFSAQAQDAKAKA